MRINLLALLLLIGLSARSAEIIPPKKTIVQVGSVIGSGVTAGSTVTWSGTHNFTTNGVTISTSLNVTGNISGSVTPASVNLSTVTSALALKVDKAGDTMTGQLTNTSTITVQGNAFSVGGATLAVVGGNVGIGTNAPAFALQVQRDGASAGIVGVSYNGGVNTISPLYLGFAARGSAAVPAAVQNNDTILFLGGRGFDGTSFGVLPSQVGISMSAAETWTPTAKGTKMFFNVAPVGSTIAATALLINSSSSTFAGVVVATVTGTGSTIFRSTFTNVPPYSATVGPGVCVTGSTVSFTPTSNTVDVINFGSAGNGNLATDCNMGILMDGNYASPFAATTGVRITQDDFVASFTYPGLAVTPNVSHTFCLFAWCSGPNVVNVNQTNVIVRPGKFGVRESY